MYQTINFSRFVDAFVDMGRQYNFAPYCENGEHIGWYDGLRVLFDYLEEMSDGTYELDVIGLCRDFSHDTALQIADKYRSDIIRQGIDADDLWESEIRKYLEDTGMLIGETEYGFVYRQH